MGKNKKQVLNGTILSPRGRDKKYSFFVNDIENQEDIFIPKRNLMGAMHEDQVVIETYIDKKYHKLTGNVIDIIRRGNKHIIGKYEQSKKFGFVVPKDSRFPDFYVPNPPKEVKDGDLVEIEVLKYSKKWNKHHTCTIKEILGKDGDPGLDILAVAKEHGLPMEFPDKVLLQLESIPLGVSKEECEGRTDFRDRIVFTIDGDDAKDLDDAVCIKLLDNGNYELGVHIADVTHYVKENTPLDREALSRGTSNYLVDRVIPMLPKKLSNGICSLNPRTDRLTLSCIMEIDKSGAVKNYTVTEGIINTIESMTYHNVQEILDNNPSICERYSHLKESISLMYELMKILRNKRMRRGALDFDFDESKIELDENGIPIDVHPYPRLESNKIIEEFMLVANETIAQWINEKEIPFVYRIHETPDEEKLMSFINFANELGYDFNYSDTNLNKNLQDILSKIKGKDEEDPLGRLLLRSLMQAKYSPYCSGHFGLAAKYYCHFTSPIRRYPDLQIHRIIKEYLHNKLTENRLTKLEGIVSYAATKSSEKEREADEIEKDIENMKKTEYMSYHIGEEYDGIVSNISEQGIYVMLPSTVEGLISINDIEEPCYYDSTRKLLKLINSGTTYNLGDKIKVKCKETNIEERKIYFEVI